MTDLYRRVLLWHKLTAQCTGGMALCSAKHKLNKEEARGWIKRLRNVSDEIEAVIRGYGFILDDKGERVVESETAKTEHEPQFFNRESTDEVAETTTKPQNAQAAALSRGGGRTLRKATRK